MQVTIATVGRERTGPYRDLFDAFRTRCPWPVTLVEIPVASAPTATRRRVLETVRLAKATSGLGRVIALEPSGRLLDSEEFATTLGLWRDEGADLGIVIGGPDGLDPGGLPRIDLALAFGRMTWPHQLARVMLMEQLYRASTILAGHPYHRG